MDEIQAARDAIAAESERSSAAVAKAKAAERAIPEKVALLAKREVDRVKASAAAVRGEIEEEVGRELEQAQAEIDAARQASEEAREASELLAAEKEEALVEAREAVLAKEAAERRLAKLKRERSTSRAAANVGAESARMEHILEDRVDVAEEVQDEKGVRGAREATHGGASGGG